MKCSRRYSLLVGLSFVLLNFVAPANAGDEYLCNPNHTPQQFFESCPGIIKNPNALPENRAAARNNLGNAYQAEKKYTVAIQEYTEAIGVKEDSRRAIYLYNRGTAYLNNGSYNRAVRDFSEGIKVDSGLMQLYGNRGLALEKMGEKKRAIADYRKALSSGPLSQWARDRLKNLGVSQ